MDLASPLSHSLLASYYLNKRRAFFSHQNDLERIQRARLRKIIDNVGCTELWKNLNPHMSYEKLASQIPLANYSDFSDQLQSQKIGRSMLLSPNPKRWEPTSGSTQNTKWIPYTEQHLSEMNHAAAAWLGDLYFQFPNIALGPHYWSLSWLPQDLRSQITANDEELFPLYQRLLLKKTMLVPAAVSTLPSIEQSWRATAILLLGATHLRLVSVWSPTFWLQILNFIHDHWFELSRDLQIGSWGRDNETLAKILGHAPKRNLTQILPGQWQKVWPHLTVISAWNSSTSKQWALEVKQQFPVANFQGKGLWATEGVVSIPIGPQKVLAYQSHFYEFKHLQSGNVLPSWQLKEGETYQPILWGSNGLLRYQLPDEVVCTGFFGKVPALEFVRRRHGIDLVGEKISRDYVEKVFELLDDCNPVTLVACRNPHPHYVLINTVKKDIDIDAILRQSHHYRLARELNQLSPAKVVTTKEPLELLRKLRGERGDGYLKVENLLEVQTFPTSPY